MPHPSYDIQKTLSAAGNVKVAFSGQMGSRCKLFIVGGIFD
jgi:hypothetical protein